MSERGKKWSVVTFSAVLSLVVGAASGVWMVAQRESSNSGRIASTERFVNDHELRLRIIESKVSEIASDTRWIRETLKAHGKP